MPDENIQTVNGNYSGRIYASDQTKLSNRKYALKINANRTLGTGNNQMSNMDYWIEHRSRFTGDSAISNGALIYMADENGTRNHSVLLDMTPNTETFRIPYNSQAHDQALQNGGSFTDSNNRWRIQITGKGGSGADSYVDVQVTDLLSPQIISQPTATQSANAGTNITLSVNATAAASPISGRNKTPTVTGSISVVQLPQPALSDLTTGMRASIASRSPIITARFIVVRVF